jgi:hypothetical protein
VYLFESLETAAMAPLASPNAPPCGQFFEGAESEIPPALYLFPIVLAVMVLPLVDIAVNLAARFRR